LEISEKNGATLLYIAASKGASIALVTLLLQYGADPEAKWQGKWKPIDIARTNNHPELVSLLTHPPPPIKSAKALLPSVQSVISALSSASLSPKPADHLMFFSYSKMDTVAETSVLSEKARHKFPASSIFRDADSKFKLSELITHVQRSKNVVVLLSGNYPKRPYTLIELHYALKSGAEVIPVKINREGMNPFNFEQVKRDIQNKAIEEYLDRDGWDLLEAHGVEVAQVCEDLKFVMNVRAYDFSVSFSHSVQGAMIEDILNAILL